MRVVCLSMCLLCQSLIGQHLDSAKKWIQHEWTLKATQNVFGSFGLINGDHKSQKVDSTWTWKFSFTENNFRMVLVNSYSDGDTQQYWYTIKGDNSFLKLLLWKQKDKKKKDKQIYKEIRIERLRPYELVLDYEENDPFWNTYGSGNLFFFENDSSSILRQKEKKLTGIWHTLDSIYLGISSFRLSRAYRGFQRGNDVVSYSINMKYKKYESNVLWGHVNCSNDSYLDSNHKVVANSVHFQSASISSLQFNNVFHELNWELKSDDEIVCSDDSLVCYYSCEMMLDSSVTFRKMKCAQLYLKK